MNLRRVDRSWKGENGMRIFGIEIIACPLLIAAFVCSPPTRAQSKGQTAEAAKIFVQSFYNWYVPVTLRDNPVPASDIALKQRSTAFSPMLFRALEEDSKAQAEAQGYIVGIDFDPFLASQDPCDHYDVGNVTHQGAGYRFDIYGVCSGKRDEKPDVIAEVARQGGSWAFTNFFYPAIHSDLLGTLKTLREERRKEKPSQ